MHPRLTFAAATAGIAGALLLAIPLVAPFAGASSHREAPRILEDPTADNTDTYVFVSTEAGRSGFVTLIANYIPLEVPQAGPNFYRFSDQVGYDINVDTDGDGSANLTYRLEFLTNVVNGNTFLYNTGKIGLPPNQGDPSSQYANLNIQQSYTLTEVDDADAPPRQGRVLLRNARVAPAHVGPKSTGTVAEYEALADAAIHTVPGAGGMRVFAGQRDEGFYVDLGATFDLLNVRRPGIDGTANFNVHTIAIEIPKSRFAASGDTNGVIGVWAAAQRQTTTVFRPRGQSPRRTGPWRPVSRLANPLVNELLIPLRAKDLYNSTIPRNDAVNIRDFIVNPGSTQGPAAFIPILRSLTGCTATDGRADLEAILLTGIPAGVVPGFPGNFDSQTPSAVPADLIRLNFNIPPSSSPNRLGLIAGDAAGFPNGRRVGDDVVDIDLKAAGGALQHLVGLPRCEAADGLSDNVSENDVPYLNRFPYLGTPHQGFASETSDDD